MTLLVVYETNPQILNLSKMHRSFHRGAAQTSKCAHWCHLERMWPFHRGQHPLELTCTIMHLVLGQKKSGQHSQQFILNNNHTLFLWMLSDVPLQLSWLCEECTLLRVDKHLIHYVLPARKILFIWRAMRLGYTFR